MVARIGDGDPPRPPSEADRPGGDVAAEVDQRPRSAPGQTSRIAARAVVGDSPLPMPPRSTAAPGCQTRAPAGVVELDRCARAPAGDVAGIARAHSSKVTS